MMNKKIAGISYMPKHVPVDFQPYFSAFSEFFFVTPKKTARRAEFIFAGAQKKEYHEKGIGKNCFSSYLYLRG